MRKDALGTAWIDLLMGTIALLTAMMCVLFLAINDPTEKNQSELVSPEQFIVTATWTEGPYDVDLWLVGPGEQKPVGFSNRAGVTWNLLRDDLGTANDNTPINYENGFTRGVPDGDYTVHLYCYRCVAPVTVTVSLQYSNGRISSNVTSKEIKFNETNEQRTAFNFVVKNKQVVSVNEVQKDVLKK